MSQPTLTFEYFDGTSWIPALTYNNTDAVLSFDLEKKLNNPATCQILLSNPSKDYNSSLPTKSASNSSQGKLTGVFTDFMKCRVKDNATNSYLFRGRIYFHEIEHHYRFGSIIRIEAKDALAELGEFPMEQAPLSLRKINLTESATNSGSEIISYLINGISDNIDTTNSDKHETSAAAYTSNEILSAEVDSDGDGLLDLSNSTQTALRVVYDIANSDQHDLASRTSTDDDSTGHMGFDYYVDTSFTRSNLRTTTAGTVDATGTSDVIAFTSATGFSVGQTIRIDEEFLLITGISTNNVTCTRAQNGTSLASHASGATIIGFSMDTAKPQMNYFPRGTRPNLINKTIADPTKHGLTITQPDDNWTGETNFNLAVKPDATFATETHKLYTSVVYNFQENPRDLGGLAVASGLPQSMTFELIEGTIANVADWEGRNLRWVPDLGVSTNAGDASESSSRQHRPTTDLGLKTPLLLYKAGSSTPCATLHYQSGTGANQYFVISNIFTAEDVTRGSSKIGLYTGEHNLSPLSPSLLFEAFPTSGTTRLFTVKAGAGSGNNPGCNLGTSDSRITQVDNASGIGSAHTDTAIKLDSIVGLQINDVITIGTEDLLITAINAGTKTLTVDRGTSGGTGTGYNGTTRAAISDNADVVCAFIDIDASTCRVKDSVGINRPYKALAENFESNDRIVRSVASLLDKHSRKTITSARLNLMEYPFVKLDADSSDVSRSGNTITFASGAFTPADGSTDINNPEQFGVRKGMVIAEIDAGGEIIRYAYIASTSSTTVVYGNSSTDTSDGTALNASNNMRIFIPVEVGHTIRVKNSVWSKNFNVLVQEIDYGLSSIGALNCTIKGAGLDNNSVGVVDTEFSYEPSLNKRYTQLPDGPLSNTAQIIAGKIVAGHSSNSALNYKTIRVVSDTSASTVTVLLANGQSYPMDVGDYTVTAAKDADASATNEWYTVFLRPGGRLTTPLSSDPKDLQIVVSDGTAPNYADIASPNTDIQLGRAKADEDTSGLCTWEPLATPNNTDEPSIDVSQIPQNRLTSALIKKGAQTYSTDLEIVRSTNTSSNSYKHIKWHGGTSATTNATIKFADGTTRTIAYGGDSDNDAANEADYSFTTDGASYTAKDNLESTTLIGGSAGAITLFAYIDLDQSVSSNLTLRLTNDNLVPYADNHVILGVITVASSSPAPLADTAPFIAPFTEKFLAINASVISANAITADEIASQISWAKIFRIASGGLFETGEGVGGGLAGVKIDSTGVYGVNGASTGVTQFHLKAADGTASCLAGDVVFDANGITIKSTNKDNQSVNFVQKGTTTYASGSTVSDYEIARIGAAGGTLAFTTKAWASSTTTTRFAIGETTEDRPYNLYINGTIHGPAASFPEGTGTDLVWNASSENIFRNVSSREYKTDIVDLTLNTEKLFDLRPVQFKFKNQDTNSFGYIAEEVYEIIPELVHLNKNSQPESIDYKLVSVLLMEEVKKLKTRIEALEGA